MLADGGMKPRIWIDPDTGERRFYVYDGEALTPLPLPPRLTMDRAYAVGWLLERLDHKKPTKQYPKPGRMIWTREMRAQDSREVVDAQYLALKQAYIATGEPLKDMPTYRTRNVYTGDTLICL